MQALILFTLAFSGSSGGEFVQKPVSQWSNADVMAWLEGLGDWAFSGNISLVFLKEVGSLHRVVIATIVYCFDRKLMVLN